MNIEKMHRFKLTACLTTIFFFLFSLQIAFGQNLNDVANIKKQVDLLQTEVETYEKLLTTEQDQDAFENEIEALRKINTELASYILSLTPIHELAQANLKDLGPAPDEKSTETEPENIQKLRKELTEKASFIEGVLRASEILSNKTSRIIKAFVSLKRDQFFTQILKKNISIFSVDLWHKAHIVLLDVINPLKLIDLKKSFMLQVSLLSLLYILFFAFAEFRSKTDYLRLRKPTIGTSDIPPYIASIPISISMMPIFIFALITYTIVSSFEYITAANSIFVYKLFYASIIIPYILFTTKYFFKVHYIRKQTKWFFQLITFIYCADLILLEYAKTYLVSVKFIVAESYLATSAIALIILFFSVHFLKRHDQYFMSGKKISIFLWIIGIFMFFSNILSYVALSRYIFESLFLILGFLSVVYVIRSNIRYSIIKLESMFQREFIQNPEEDKEKLLQFWLNFAADTVLLIASLPVIARILGVDWQNIKIVMLEAFFGFKVGSITISFANIIVSIAVFLGILFITRFLIKVADETILPKTKLDKSVRVSLTQVLSYIGLAIAFLAGISIIGFNLTNLALIAGALSVGIGFGLQSIVNNFVSGLIILFERPIKVGDWVIVNSGEGTVKKISVRATEIETFDRTSIIVPNSEFITSSVKNWTHKDRIGRGAITIGVSYEADPELVYDLLIEAAKESKDVLDKPEPFAYFFDYGDNALMFELRFFITNIRQIYRVSTKLRFDIWKKLKEHNIEIPFPQRDIHIKTPLIFNETKEETS